VFLARDSTCPGEFFEQIVVARHVGSRKELLFLGLAKSIPIDVLLTQVLVSNYRAVPTFGRWLDILCPLVDTSGGIAICADPSRLLKINESIFDCPWTGLGGRIIDHDVDRVL